MENKLLNLLYLEWLNTHDPYKDDFDEWIYNETRLTISKYGDLEYTILQHPKG